MIEIMIKYISTLLFILFSALSLWAQEKYSAKWFSADNGQLPQNSVKSIVKDKYGFIWMTTENGLVRYDGLNFVHYGVGGMIENRTTIIEGSAENDFLYTFYSSGLMRVIHSRKAELIELDDNRKDHKYLKNLHEANILRATKIIDASVQKKQYTFFDGIRNSKYVLDNSQLSYIQNKKVIFKSNFQNYEFQKFFLNKNTLFYFKSTHEIEKIDHNGRIEKIKVKIDVRDSDYCLINNLPNQQFFLITEHSIYFADYSTGLLQFKLIYEGSEVHKENLKSIYYDRENEILFLGNGIKGLCIIKKQQIKVFDGNSPSFDSYYSIDTFTENSIITGRHATIFSHLGLVEKLDFEFEKVHRFESGQLNDMFGLVLTYDKQHKIIKQYNSIYLLEVSTREIKKLFSVETNIYTIALGNQDTIWFSYEDRLGYFHLKNGKSSVEFINFKISARCIYVQGDNVLLGTEKGLYLYNQKTKKLDYLHSANIRNISSQDGVNIWMSTYGKGLYLYRDKKIFKLRSPENFPIETPHNVLEDRFGYYWLSTNNGLFQVKKDNFINYIQAKDSAVYLYKYDKTDGLITNEFNGGTVNCGVRLENDYIVFPSINGVVFINTPYMSPIKVNKNFFVERASRDGEILYFKNSLHLDRNFMAIHINVDCPNYGNPDNLYIEYSINNSGRWLKLSKDGIITIPNLGHGKHSVQVRKLKSFEGTYDYKDVQLFIEPAYWETTWFRLLCVVVLASLVFGIIKLRIAYVEKENEMLNQKIEEKTVKQREIINSLNNTREELDLLINNQEKLIRIITHDMKSPLKFLNMGTKYLLDNTKTQDIEYNNVVQSVYESSFQIYNFIENILNYSKAVLNKESENTEQVDLTQLFTDKANLFDKIASYKGIQIKNTLTEPTFITANKPFISIIVHNLLDNALKYTDKGEVTLAYFSKGKKSILSVKDTGIGMSAEIINLYMNKHTETDKLGLKIIKELLLAMNGKMEIISIPQKGTTVQILFNKPV